MARRPLTPDAQNAANAVRRALGAEKAEEVEARIAAEAFFQERMTHAREQTNAALYRARVGFNLSVTVLTEQGFGTNRRKVMDRLQEYVSAHPGTQLDAEEDRAEEVARAASTVGLAVQRDSSGVTVTFDDYTHPDLGVGITGTVTYSTEGDEESHTATLDRFYDENPVWGMFAWQVPEILSQT